MTRIQRSKLTVFALLGIAGIALMGLYFTSIYQRGIPQPPASTGLPYSPQTAQYHAYCRMPDGRAISGVADFGTANPAATQHVEIRSPENGNSLGVVRLSEAECRFSGMGAANAGGENG